MNPAVDPWVITARERAKYVEQFRALKPDAKGFVVGAQVREFFLQSQLQPLVLGEIWALSDTDSDGRMDINEFSIACKLINLKLRSFDIPKQLPGPLLISLKQHQQQQQPTQPPQPPSAAQSPLAANHYGAVPPIAAASATVNHGMATTTTPPKVPPMVPPMSKPLPPLVQPMMMQPQPQPHPHQPPVVPPMTHPAPLAAAIPPLIPGMGAMMQQQQLLHSPPDANMSLLLGNVAAPHSAAVSALPAPPTPPSGTPSRSASINGSLAAVEARSPPQPLHAEPEWAVRPQSKLKYTQLFNTTDRTRCGFLTGAQARHLMVQSKLPQAQLAQIWAMSDMDLDGRLGCEEFVLAMYLCECAAQGEKIPDKLPPELVPPMFRKRVGSVASLAGVGGVAVAPTTAGSRHDSVVSATGGLGGIVGSVGGSRHGSVSSQGAAAGGGVSMTDGAMDAMAGLHNQTSFEDKRKENYDKGQAELERRRKVLVDAQRKEQEERERKERDEADKREKARLEAERRQQEEIERQMQRQREIEQEKEEKRLRDIETKEAARKELEKQRQQEWVRQRLTEMQMQRQHEQEHVLKLKSLNQTHNIELTKLNDRIKELSQKICDTRANVTNVKSVIDGMRTTRDTQMAEMAQHKAQIVEQNQRLIQLSQEKAKLDSRNKTAAAGDPNDADAGRFSNKQILINQLRGRIDTGRTDLLAKQADAEAGAAELAELRTGLGGLLDDCEDMYADYDRQRTQLLELRNNARNEQSMANSAATAAWDMNSAWSSSTATGTADAGLTSATAEPAATYAAAPAAVSAASAASGTANANYAGYARYRALYEFAGRNADEISFQPGDIVMVPLEQNAEPGWKAGEIGGHTGWFPETYVEPADDDDGIGAAHDVAVAEPEAKSMSAIQSPVNENIPQPASVTSVANATEAPADATAAAAAAGAGGDSQYIACYPYESAEPGDLTFVAGELITVVQKDGDWWTGVIGGTRTGMFPSNYVQPTVETPTAAANQANNNDNTTAAAAASGMAASTTAAAGGYDAAGAADEARTLEDADSEVSEINTKPMMDAVAADQQAQQEYGRPMSTTSTSFRKQKGEVAQVIAAYEATSTEQLSLTRGQLIMIRKKTDSGWWEGELQARGRRRQIGWFPATYVKVLQSGRLSGRSTPVSGGKIQMNEAVLDKVIALFTYKAQNDDELSFEKDDIISVMGRNEPEWWYGECSGLIGLFPSNYVGPFVNAGNM